MSPSGRIPRSERPIIDYSTLKPARKGRPTSNRISVDEIPEYLRILIEDSFNEGMSYYQEIEDSDPAEAKKKADEIVRQCHAYGRVREPEISVKAKVQSTETRDGMTVYHVEIRGGVKSKRPRKNTLTVVPSGPTATA